MPADTEFLPNATLRVRDVRKANVLWGDKVQQTTRTSTHACTHTFCAHLDSH